MNLLAVALYPVGVRVQLQAAGVDERLPESALAPGDGADAGGELAECEWLHEVVIGALVEALDAVPDGAPRGQHDDTAREAVFSQPPADLDAVQLGQVQVEADDVVVVDARLVERFDRRTPHRPHIPVL
jgi:hypothetical protein